LEHPSILEPLEVLAADGHDLFFAAVDPEGRIDPERLVSDALSKKVGLISVHLANNEIGVLQPIAELSARLSELPKEGRPRLHIDAVQAVGRIPLDLGGALRGVDLATLSMHKIGGPHGVGVLVRRSGCALKPRAFGGGQEDEMRAGTENAAAISAAALALELALAEEGQTAINHRAWSTQMWHTLSATFPEMELAGPSPNFADKRLPNTLNVRMPGTDARMLVTRFDVDGLELSAGSACASGAVEPSHVLLALGLDEQEARAGLRISLGWTTSETDCKSAVGRMVKVFSSSHATSDNSSTL
jgi:cysteine desulfurase